jgi:hypothetical protein
VVWTVSKRSDGGGGGRRSGFQVSGLSLPEKPVERVWAGLRAHLFERAGLRQFDELLSTRQLSQKKKK